MLKRLRTFDAGLVFAAVSLGSVTGGFLLSMFAEPDDLVFRIYLAFMMSVAFVGLIGFWWGICSLWRRAFKRDEHGTAMPRSREQWFWAIFLRVLLTAVTFAALCFTASLAISAWHFGTVNDLASLLSSAGVRVTAVAVFALVGAVFVSGRIKSRSPRNGEDGPC